MNASHKYGKNSSEAAIRPIIGHMRLRSVFVLTMVLAITAASHAATDTAPRSITEFARSISASVSWDPLLKQGYLQKEGSFISFALGQPFVALGWKKLMRVDPPRLSGDTVVVGADFMRTAEDYLKTAKELSKEHYRVAAILVDAGHGGKDTGAIAEIGGTKLYEKNLTLAVSRRVAELLRGRYPDREILETRRGDSYPSLDDRVAMANSVALKNDEAVIYVSIHANASFNKSAKGFEVWYLNPEYRRTVVDAQTVREKGQEIAPILNAMLEEEFTTESIILARKVYDRLGLQIGAQSPGRGIRAEEWFVVRNAKMPSILIEMGFITHPEEGELMASSGYLRKIGDAIFSGIVDFVDHFEN